jgi:hypothetical protein
MTFTGRVLDEAGVPRAASELFVQCGVDQPEQPPELFAGFLRVKSSREGRFAFEAPRSTTGRHRVGIRDEKSHATVLVAVGHGGGAVHDLGDLVLRAPPVLASGTILDVRGQPVEGALVHPDREVGGIELPGRSGRDGSFVVLGPREDARGLDVSKEGFHPKSVVLPAAGEPLVIVLERLGVVEGRVLLGDGWDAAGVMAVTGDGTFRSLEPDGTFRFEARAGPLRLAFFFADQASPSAPEPDSAAAVVTTYVRADERAKLDPVDLRGKARPVLLSVVDETGRPLPEWDLTVLSRRPWTETVAGRKQILLAAPVDLEVGARGRRSARLKRVDADVTAVLGPPCRVVVRVDGIPPSLPRGVTALVSIESEANELGRPFHSNRAPIDGNGAARLSATLAGPWSASVLLRRAGRKAMHFRIVRTIRIEIADADHEQAFEIRLGPEPFDQALQWIMQQE